MSKYDYKKEITNSLKEVSIVTLVTIGIFMELKYLFTVSPPIAKIELSNSSKLAPLDSA